MTYVITNLCTNDASCVDVCPVACIHTKPGAPQFYIDPEVCIECEQCEIVCPPDAIFIDTEVPNEHISAIEANAAFFRENKAAAGPVSFETAWDVVLAAQTYATREGIQISAAVVDEAGSPIAVGRMDGAEPNTTELAFNKAYTAAAFHLPSAELGSVAQPACLRSLTIAHSGRIMPVDGGLAIVDGVAIVGGIGVAGGRPEQDVLCCQAALSALGR